MLPKIIQIRIDVLATNKAALKIDINKPAA
jgi:hypothetical protein